MALELLSVISLKESSKSDYQSELQVTERQDSIYTFYAQVVVLEIRVPNGSELYEVNSS
jgi:hypothetical protein